MQATSETAPTLIAASGDSLREAFGKALSQLAYEFPQLVVLDADIAGGTGAHHFRKSHPDRFLQFGIAEQNMMAAAGGLAAVGLMESVLNALHFQIECMVARQRQQVKAESCQRVERFRRREKSPALMNGLALFGNC